MVCVVIEAVQQHCKIDDSLKEVGSTNREANGLTFFVLKTAVHTGNTLLGWCRIRRSCNRRPGKQISAATNDSLKYGSTWRYFGIPMDFVPPFDAGLGYIQPAVLEI